MGGNVFETVKQSITTREAAEHYGIEVKRNGMACCPFHDDRTPSLKLDRRFHCFGCGADGDVIDFAARLYNLSPKEAEMCIRDRRQVGNVGGYPYWSWYGFNSRVEWCACFVSWCYNQAGKSEPRFAGCQSQGVPWFQSHGQWGGRGYANIAPGDAIFFDWDLDGSADHVGIVIGTDGSRVYTVEGNSGDVCKIKSYDLNYQCIKGYGLMNWN